MPIKTMIMKYINNQLAIAVLAVVCSVGTVTAQEIIKDSIKPKPQTSPSKKLKVDGIIATVGDYLV